MAQYDLLPPELRWRHMRYDLVCDPPVDFTWEREWRVPSERLEFDSQTASIVVPDCSWAQR